jgi:putative membrane protein
VTEQAAKLGSLSNDLALDRTYLASERTLMGWIRTAISMISFGFTIGKLSQIIDEIEFHGLWRVRMMSVTSVARTLVVLGTTGLAMACVQHRGRIKSLRTMGLTRPISITLVIGVLLTMLGAFAFVALAMAL